MSDKMLQEVMTSPGCIEFHSVDVPVPAEGQVLVRIHQIGVCGSDIHVYHGKHPFTKYPVTQGHEVSVDMVAKAIAEHQEEGFFQTDDIASLKELLGFDLDYLNLVSSEWKIDNTSTIINQDYIMTTLHYSKVNDSNKSFRYVISWFLNPEDASYSIEQKKKGYVREYNNIEVYFLDNTNSCSCCWIAGTSVHVITSSMDARTLERITEILLGDQHEKSNNTSMYFSVYSSYI